MSLRDYPPLTDLISRACGEATKERDSEIMHLRYGLMSDEFHTLQEIGDIFGISRERVRQIVTRGLRRLHSGAARAQKAATQTGPYAELAGFVTRALSTDDPGAGERLALLLDDQLPQVPFFQAVSLVAPLAGLRGDQLVQLQSEAAVAFEARTLAPRAARQAQSKLEHLLSRVFWPADARRYTESDFSLFSPQRSVRLDGEGRAGMFDSRKMGREIQFESLLERQFLDLLELAPSVTHYCEQPVRIQSDEVGLYTPDAAVRLHDGRMVLVEVKPYYRMALHANWQKWRVLRAYCAGFGYGFMITDCRQCFQDLLRVPVDREWEDALINELERQGPMSWPAYLQFRAAFPAGSYQLLAVTVRRRLFMSHHPFVLQLGET